MVRPGIPVFHQMAHEASHLPFLLGIGVRQFSVDPQFLPSLQEAISRIRLSDAEEYAGLLLSKPSLKETVSLMEDEGWKRRFGRM